MSLSSFARRGLPLAVAGAATAAALGTHVAFAATETVQIVATGPSCTSSTFCYVPATQNAASGDTVTWSNTSPDVHTVTRCSATACSGQDGGTGTDTLDSGGNIAPVTGTFSHAFSGPGTYFYYCAIHGYSTMHGEVIVSAVPPPNTPEVPLTVLIAVIGGGIAVLAARREWRRQQPESL